MSAPKPRNKSESTTGAAVDTAPRLPKPLPWQRVLWSQVAEGMRANRLGHALLLAGPAGAGKRHFAYCIAAALWCRQCDADGAACGSCPDCRQVVSEAHSGFFVLRVAEGKRDIPISDVRMISEKLSYTAQDGRAKVVILDPVDALNSSGVNALLKTIEEPTPGTHLLLISERPQALTATLRSRCQRLKLAVPQYAEACAWLLENVNSTSDPSSAEQIDAALGLAHGAPLRAVELLSGNHLALRAAWAGGLQDLAAGRADPLTVAAGVADSDPAEYVQWLYGWLGELLRLRAGAAVPGSDKAAGSLAARLAPEWLDRYIAEVQEALYRVQTNASKPLLIESLLIGWVALLARSAGRAQNRAS